MSILRMSEVKAETGHRSHATVYTSVHSGLFTEPVQIGERSVGWPDHEVTAINNARIAGSTDDEIRQLVDQLHQQRVAGTGKTFQSKWRDRHQRLSETAKRRTKAKPSKRAEA